MFRTVHTLAVGPTHTHIRVQRVPVREDHKVSASGAEIKDAWNYNYAPKYDITAWQLPSKA